MQTALGARPYVLNRLRTAPPAEKPDDLHALLDRFLRDVVGQQLEEEKASPGVLSGFFEAFQTYLIGTLTPEDFADLFAQTIAYGLFAARTRAGDGFNRRAAFDNIPHTIGVLRDLFRFLSLDDLPEQLAWCVDDIAEVLAVADASGILDRYYHEHKGSDPIVHFYESFLARYDPAERQRRGVYYTPEPVVGYIVRSLHGLLKTDFGQRDVLASDGVTILDPAAGTMTFIARAAQQAVDEFVAKYGSGGCEDFIRRHVLKNFYAFELMMAPYAVGHLKMASFSKSSVTALPTTSASPSTSPTPSTTRSSNEAACPASRRWPRNPGSRAGSRSKPLFSSSSAIPLTPAIPPTRANGFGG